MPILFSAVSRGTVVLAKYATCAGNFTEVTEQILSKIPPHDDKLTYSHGIHQFHYISENKFVYFCITDNKFERSRAFLFLDEIKTKFKAVFGDTAQTSITNAMNGEFARVLAADMKPYNTSPDFERFTRIHEELDDLKDIMIQNIDSMVKRGEKLELLVNRADHLATNSVSYHATSRTLQRSLFWKNIRVYVILALVAVPFAYLIGVVSCGGLKWRKCLE